MGYLILERKNNFFLFHSRKELAFCSTRVTHDVISLKLAKIVIFANVLGLSLVMVICIKSVKFAKFTNISGPSGDIVWLHLVKIVSFTRVTHDVICIKIAAIWWYNLHKNRQFALANLTYFRQSCQLHWGNSWCNLHKNRQFRQIRQHISPISGDIICIKIATLPTASVWRDFVKSAIFVTACISGHKCIFRQNR